MADIAKKAAAMEGVRFCLYSIWMAEIQTVTSLQKSLSLSSKEVAEAIDCQR